MRNNIFEQQYKTLLMKALVNGSLTENRTEIKTYKLFNENLNIDLKYGFPIITGKKYFLIKHYLSLNGYMREKLI